MTDRFECPRCQHVFASEAADQAFAECPQCGSLALPREVSAEGAAVAGSAADAGLTNVDSTEFGAMSLTDALGSAGDTFSSGGGAFTSSPSGEFASDTQVAPAPAPPASGLDSGIFQGLLPEEPAAEMPPGALHSDPGADPLSTSEGPAEGPTLADVGSVPSGEGNLPPSMALTRALSGEGAPLGDAPSADTQVSANPLPPSMSLTRGAGDTLSGGDDFEAAATRTYTADPAALFASLDGGGEEHSDDFDPFKGIELPSGGDSVDLSVTPGGAFAADGAFGDGPTMEVAPIAGGFAPDASEPSVPPEMSLSDEAGAFEGGEVTAVGPAPTQMDTEVGAVGAVTLSELERQLPAGTPLEMFNLGAGADLFGDEAFGDLERAFDDVASTPDAPVFEPVTSKTAEQLVEEAIAAQLAEEAGTPHAPRPPDAPGPPPLRLRKQTRVPHLSLTAEAIEAAALPITSMEMSALNPAPADPFNEVQDSPNVNFLDEETDIVMRRPKSHAGESSPRVLGTAAVSSEGEPATSQTALKPIDGEKRLFSGFTLGRVVAAAVFFALLGGVAGGLLAPNEADKPRTKSDRAREIYAKGNRFYEEGRFDDALGDYRSALAIDPSFTPALRAKGAALAKQRRYKEAARAYEEYLERDPDAFDASQVREVLERYRGDDEEEDS
jgi:hypothetical protein